VVAIYFRKEKSGERAIHGSELELQRHAFQVLYLHVKENIDIAYIYVYISKYAILNAALDSLILIDIL
jgi:hypothetical protein